MSEYRLYQPTCRDRKGEARKATKWYVEFTDHLRVRHRWPLDRQQRDSERKADRIVELVRCRTHADAPDEKLLRWLDACPPDLREKLAAAGIVDAEHSAKLEPLAVHLEGKTNADCTLTLPGYRHHLTAGRDRAGYADLMVGLVKRVFEGCGLVYWRDLSGPGVTTRIGTFLGDLRTRGEITGTTLNYYCREVRGFCRWMVSSRRATSSPLASLRGVTDADTDKQETRELSGEEIGWLLAVTEQAGPWKRFDAVDRVLLYRVAFETGIRPGQLRQLTVTAFRLDEEPPHVVAKAATVKRRKEQVQALRPELAVALKAALANKMPDVPALVMPDKFTCAEMFRADLRAAREVWISAATDPGEREKRHRSDFLAEKDANGRRAIFYSLRHSHGVALADAGWRKRMWPPACTTPRPRPALSLKYVKVAKSTKPGYLPVLSRPHPFEPLETRPPRPQTGTSSRAGSRPKPRLSESCPM